MLRKERLTRNICIKVTEDEYEDILEACKKRKLGIAQYLMYVMNKSDKIQFRERGYKNESKAD